MRKLLILVVSVFLLAFVAPLFLPSSISALSDEQRRLYNSGVYLYDISGGQGVVGCPGSPLTGDNNAIKVYNYLIENMDLSPAQVSGIIGNLMRETGSDTYDLNPRGIGRGMCYAGSNCTGIAQWDDRRWNPLVAWAEQQGIDPWDLQTQAAYIKHELENPGRFDHWRNTLTNLQNIEGNTAAAADAAAREFNRTYEVGLHTDQRANNARRFFNEVASSGEVDVSSNTSPGSNATCPGGYGQEGNFIWPVANTEHGTGGLSLGVMCWNGPRSGGRKHGGIDVSGLGRTNVPIIAVDGGVVEVARRAGGLGETIVIDHGYGLWTMYSHLASISVSQGQQVSQGDTIGIMGSTGGDYAIHLHFQVHDRSGIVPSRADLTLNPMNYLPDDGRDTGHCIPGDAGYRGA